MKAKSNLTLILRYKSNQDEDFKPGRIVQVFLKKRTEKRGKLTGNKMVLEYDEESRMVTVPVSNCKRSRSAI